MMYVPACVFAINGPARVCSITSHTRVHAHVQVLQRVKAAMKRALQESLVAFRAELAETQAGLREVSSRICIVVGHA